MSGGVAQLLALGQQDTHIVGNPEISFFRSSFRRHTNFAQTVERQTIQGNVTAGGISTIRLERKGDLCSYMYLMPIDTSGPKANVSISDWSTCIDYVELLIGGTVVDKQTSEFVQHIAPRLLAPNMSKSRLGNIYGGTTNSSFYPLRFFFNESWQTALNLVGLQYHDVEIRIRWANDAAAAASKWEAYANFIFLDEAERSYFASGETQDVMVYQVQEAIPSNGKMQELNFNHPVKFLAATSTSAVSILGETNKVKLQINGTDVSDFKFARPNYTQIPLYYHIPFADRIDATDEGKLFVYPFCLESSKTQSTGSLNFSRLDSARLVSETANSAQKIYAVNYNILRYAKGLGALLYAN